MSKAKDTRRLAENQAMAQNNSIRSSARKLNLVAQTIRGLSAEKAVAELSFSKKRIAKVALEVLKSAIANAENNHNMDVDRLIVAEAYVGKALVMKRWQARARGRAGRIKKVFSNLTVVVRENEENR